MTRKRLSTATKVRIFYDADGRCHICKQKIVNKEWEVEHIVPLALGGWDYPSNMAPAHKACHAPKTAADLGQIAKAKRQEARHIGARQSKRPMSGGRGDKWKRTLDGRTVLR